MGLFLFSTENSFRLALNQLEKAPIKTFFQQVVLENASDLLREPDGIIKLYEYAPLFDQAGLFSGKPWESVQNLNANLVRGTLQASRLTATAEILSNLRVLAIARGDYVHPNMTEHEATEFLTKVMAMNLDLLLMKETEENRVKMLYKDNQASELLGFISDHCFSPLVFQHLFEEVDRLASQRPIVTNKVLKLIASAKRLASRVEENSSLVVYERAVYSPSSLSAQSSIENYEEKLKTTNHLLMTQEAHELRESMEQTGLVSDFHVIFLNHIIKEKTDLLPSLLCLDDKAKENLRLNQSFVSSLIQSSLTIQTKKSLYGLVRLLQRDLFTKQFIEAFEKLLAAPLHAQIKDTLTSVHKLTDQDDLRSLLISDTISVLGQPLGIGQGFNPSCQSTRAISYWSQKQPVLLLKMLNHFFENGTIIMSFEERVLSSDTLPLVALDDIDHIDTLSLLLVPHLNALYLEMLNLAKLRGQDPHRWINPAFHIKGIWTEFSDSYSDLEFKNKFNHYYHPTNNPDVNKELPQPVGINISNQAGQVLGAHAVLIQRVELDPSGCVRVYFYNPNNDRLQVWGSAIRTSVSGNGETEGESSLPFDDFLHCLYAFHYPKQNKSLVPPHSTES